MTEKFYNINKDGSKEEIEDIWEANRITSSNSYNDNYELVNYTSELRDGKDRFFAFIDFHENEGTIRECPHCLEYEIHNKLKPRILKKGEQRPPDYDDFIQCYECGNIFPIYEAHYESQIKDSLETVNNPFESNESVFLCTDSRATQRREGKKRKGRFSYKQEHEDPEIQAAIDKGLAVNILYDSKS